MKKKDVVAMQVRELNALRKEIERRVDQAPRWNADPRDVQKSVARLVLALIEFLRRLLEKQAIRRMEARTLTDQQTEDIGRALMKLEETVVDIAAKFGILPEDRRRHLATGSRQRVARSWQPTAKRSGRGAVQKRARLATLLATPSAVHASGTRTSPFSSPLPLRSGSRASSAWSRSTPSTTSTSTCPMAASIAAQVGE